MKYWVLAFTTFFIFGCQSNQQEQSTESTYQTSGQLEFATNFSFSNNELVVSQPWPGAVKPKVYSLQDSIKRIVVTSTTHLPYLELLGLEDRLVGFPNTNYISSEKIRSLVDQGKVKDLGTDGNINLEILISLNPDAVIAFDMGSESSSLDKIAEAGIPVIYNADYLESSALGRAEWIKFFGALFHKEAEADSIFSSIVTTYDSLKTLTTSIENRPSIVSGVLYGDVWFLPGGKNWASGFFKDAGGHYLWEQDSTGGWLELSFESVFDKARTADYWIGTSTFNSATALKGQDERYADFDAFQNGKLYNYSKRLNEFGGYDFFESGYARPDLVLADMIKILHPELLPAYETYYYEQLQ